MSAPARLVVVSKVRHRPGHFLDCGFDGLSPETRTASRVPGRSRSQFRRRKSPSTADLWILFEVGADFSQQWWINL